MDDLSASLEKLQNLLDAVKKAHQERVEATEGVEYATTWDAMERYWNAKDQYGLRVCELGGQFELIQTVISRLQWDSVCAIKRAPKKEKSWMSLPKISPIFAWYDFWVGVFWDRKKKRLYIFPIPMCGLMVNFENGE